MGKGYLLMPGKNNTLTLACPKTFVLLAFLILSIFPVYSFADFSYFDDATTHYDLYSAFGPMLMSQTSSYINVDSLISSFTEEEKSKDEYDLVTGFFNIFCGKIIFIIDNGSPLFNPFGIGFDCCRIHSYENIGKISRSVYF